MAEEVGSNSELGARAQELEHLKYLERHEQQILCRGESMWAVREDARLLHDIRGTIEAYGQAAAYCKAASESDPEWFTLDVQNYHKQRQTILRDALSALEADMPTAHEDAQKIDGFRGRLFGVYAHTAQATSRLSTGLSENDKVQKLAETGHVLADSTKQLFGRLNSHLASFGGSPPAQSTSEFPEAVSVEAVSAPSEALSDDMPLIGSGARDFQQDVGVGSGASSSTAASSSAAPPPAGGEERGAADAQVQQTRGGDPFLLGGAGLGFGSGKAVGGRYGGEEGACFGGKDGDGGEGAPPGQPSERAS